MINDLLVDYNLYAIVHCLYILWKRVKARRKWNEIHTGNKSSMVTEDAKKHGSLPNSLPNIEGKLTRYVVSLPEKEIYFNDNIKHLGLYCGYAFYQ